MGCNFIITGYFLNAAKKYAKAKKQSRLDNGVPCVLCQIERYIVT
jgi:hypothetical protein